LGVELIMVQTPDRLNCSRHW
ncbi:hypothetical protein A2U01_0112480, partial [Trifolium medium]|nr:hypothetical protein [Trifolium medium]